MTSMNLAEISATSLWANLLAARRGDRAVRQQARQMVRVIALAHPEPVVRTTARGALAVLLRDAIALGELPAGAGA